MAREQRVRYGCLQVNEFLEHIIKSTNMKCLTPRSALDGDCGFLAANLYAGRLSIASHTSLF